MQTNPSRLCYRIGDVLTRLERLRNEEEELNVELNSLCDQLGPCLPLDSVLIQDATGTTFRLAKSRRGLTAELMLTARPGEIDWLAIDSDEDDDAEEVA